MNPISKEYLQEVIANIAREINLAAPWTYTVENFDVIAQNYFGVLIPIVLKGEQEESNQCISSKIVVKLAPTDTALRVSGALTLMFAKEIFFYSTVLKEYNNIQRDISNKFLAPECVYYRDEYCKEVIALQDMTSLGFKPFTESNFLDFDHMQLAVESLAKLHALSFATALFNNDSYQLIAKTCVPLNEKTNQRFMIILEDRLTKARDKFNDTSNFKYIPLLELIKTNFIKYVNDMSENVNALCLSHGDMWKENILFKYKVSKSICFWKKIKPVAACLIDYQTVRMSSPAYDILYLITTSTDKKLRKENFNKLLDKYYDTLAGFLEDLYIDYHCAYHRELFNEDLKTVAPACFIIANTALWLSCGLQQEGNVRSKIVFSNESEKEEAIKRYVGIVKDIIDDYEEMGLLDLVMYG